MRFRIWHLLIFVTLAAVFFWLYTQIGMNTARYEIVKMSVHHDDQWDKYWSRIRWKIRLPMELKGKEFTSFLEVDKEFSSAGYKVGDVIRFRFREMEFLGRPSENPKKKLVNNLFQVAGNVLEDNGGDIFAGPFPTLTKDESNAEWE